MHTLCIPAQPSDRYAKLLATKCSFSHNLFAPFIAVVRFSSRLKKRHNFLSSPFHLMNGILSVSHFPTIKCMFSFISFKCQARAHINVRLLRFMLRANEIARYTRTQNVTRTHFSFVFVHLRIFANVQTLGYKSSSCYPIEIMV